MTTDDERLRRDEVIRGERARALLAEPLLAEAFRSIEQEYTAAWIASPVRDAQARETIWQHLQALRKVWSHLEGVVTTGVMARQQLAELRANAEGVGRGAGQRTDEP